MLKTRLSEHGKPPVAHLCTFQSTYRIRTFEMRRVLSSGHLVTGPHRVKAFFCFSIFSSHSIHLP